MRKYWDELKAPDFKKVSSRDVAVLVIGSCEQHGKHLPTGTDAILGKKIAELAAEKSRKKVYVLPPIAYGFSAHHMDFKGSITLKQSTLSAVLQELTQGVLAAGITNVVFLLSHGGNSAAVHTAVNELGQKYEQGNFVMLKYWDFMREFAQDIRETPLGGIGHAGEMETSLMKAIRPELVGENISDYRLAEGNEWYHPDMFASSKITIYQNFKDVSPYGNVGVCETASSEKGEKILSYVTGEIARFLDEYF